MTNTIPQSRHAIHEHSPATHQPPPTHTCWNAYIHMCSPHPHITAASSSLAFLCHTSTLWSVAIILLPIFFTSLVTQVMWCHSSNLYTDYQWAPTSSIYSLFYSQIPMALSPTSLKSLYDPANSVSPTILCCSDVSSTLSSWLLYA